MTYHDEHTVIRKIREGDKSVFADVYQAYYLDLYYFIKRYVRNPEISDDIIQDLFLHIWMNRENWNPRGTIKDYFLRAARNRAFDYLDHKKVEFRYLEKQLRDIEAEWEAYITSSNVPFSNNRESEDKELLKIIQEGISRLPKRRKLILSMSWDEGLTYTEIAEFLDISVKTVETQMGRAFKFLRDYLSEHLAK